MFQEDALNSLSVTDSQRKYDINSNEFQPPYINYKGNVWNTKYEGDLSNPQDRNNLQLLKQVFFFLIEFYECTMCVYNK